LSIFTPPKKKTTKARKASSDYEIQKERARKRINEQSAAGRDIGPIPEAKNKRRRSSCKNNLKKFCETYNPEAFYHGWSKSHTQAIKRIEEAVKTGALYAFAMPRGSGKTTLSRMAALWAVLYAHRRYVYIIGANADKAQESLEAIKIWLRFLPRLAEDFPEVAAPVIALGGIAHRANGQTSEGRSTLIQWGKHKIVLPTVSTGKANAPTSGIILAASGLTGDGIRGSVHTLKSGAQIRPDLVLLDDPQTDESAASPSQNKKRESLISGAVLGMAGPGKSISAVMPCTVIQREDMVDRILNRELHPLWRGTRSRMLESMPANMAAWEPYFDLYDDCALAEPPNFDAANDYYTENRAELDKGARASWEDRHLETEVSAIQSAMNLYHRDRAAFFAEYQNEPEESETAKASISPAEVYAKAINMQKRQIPLACEHLTTFIDVQKKCLWYMTVAWSDAFGGHILDYGAWPDQQRAYFTLGDIRKTLQRKYPRLSLEGQIYEGLTSLIGEILDRSYTREDGEPMSPALVMIDANWGETSSVVKKVCREYGDRRLLASHGAALGPDKKPMLEYKTRPGERKGWNWILYAKGREGRHVRYDGNQFKSLIASRIRAGIGDAETLTLYKGDSQSHRMVAEQIGAEYPIPTTAIGRTVDVWKAKPNRDNHLLDCLVGAAVAASVVGVKAIGHELGRAGKPKPRRKHSVNF